MKLQLLASALTFAAVFPAFPAAEREIPSPVLFERNEGQYPSPIQYSLRGRDHFMWFTRSGMTIQLAPGAQPVGIEWLNGLSETSVSGSGLTETRSNYLLGNDPKRWKTNVANFATVRYSQLYPGVDLIYYGRARELEYDLVVAPEADPRRIEMKVSGAGIHLDANGRLVFKTASGELLQRKPLVYQDTATGRQSVEGRFVLRGEDRVGFEIDQYDHSQELIIDPVWTYNLYYPGAANARPGSVAVDATGVYLAGGVGDSGNRSPMLTTPGALQGSLSPSVLHGFVMKVGLDGYSIQYLTYLGGSREDEVWAIAVDSSGNVYVTGRTASRDFPLTAGAFQASFPGNPYSSDQLSFVAKLSAAGDHLIYATLLGGVDDATAAIAVDQAGAAYVTGQARSSSFPVTPGAVQFTKRAAWYAFLSKLNPSGSALAYSTFMGGASQGGGTGVAVDTAGNAYVGGWSYGNDFPTTPGSVQMPFPLSSYPTHAFVCKLNATGSSFIYAAAIGGESDDAASGIAIDSAGNAYITGTTRSSKFPVSSGDYPQYWDGQTRIYVTKLSPDGSQLVYSTKLVDDGNHYEVTRSYVAIRIDSRGGAHLAGHLQTNTFTTTYDALLTSNPAGVNWPYTAVGFYSVLNAAGTALAYSTYYYAPNPALALSPGYAYTVSSAFVPFDNSYPLLGKIPLGYPALRIASSHTGNFAWGQTNALYMLTVTNEGAYPTSGQVTVTENPPAGLSLLSLSGDGWICSSNSCKRSDVLASGASYPSITAMVSVAGNATSPLLNAVSVSGGGADAVSTTDSTNIGAFADVSPADFFFDAVTLMRGYGITNGCQASPPMYCPNDNVTRAQMAVFVVRSVMGGDLFTYSPTPHFNDVPADAFGFKWIQKMVELGITAGCGNGNYCPNDTVTRGQMAVFVVRARLGTAADGTFLYPPTPYFTDAAATHPFFKWIQRMKLEQITSGCGTGSTYCPEDPVTRGQMAIFIMRGAFNQLLPSGTPVIASVTPALTSIGQSTVLSIIGTNTHFAQGTSQVNAGPGVTVGTITVTGATSLNVQLTVAANAAAGPRSIVVTTGSEQAILPNGLTVQ